MGELPPTRHAPAAIFACDDGQAYAISDVVAAAYFRGELQAPWQRLLIRRAAEEHADEHDLEPDDEVMQALSDEFRSDRDLITAEETERWLEQRGLSLDDFSDFFVRKFWGELLGSKIEPEAIQYDSAFDEDRALLTAELLFSGDFDQMATALSWRVAARRAAEAAKTDPTIIAAERNRFLERAQVEESTLDDWLEGTRRDAAWLEEMLEVEVAYGQARATLVTDSLCRAELAAARLQLARVDLETIELESRDAASEALLCVRSDGLTLEEVAAEGGYPHRRETILLEDLPADLHERILCIAPGDLLDPVARGEGFQVCRVHEKSEPDLADAEVRRRIEERILERSFAELCAKHIRWRTPLTSTP